jgi:hypothetical protein
MVTPMTAYPSSLRRAAATDESTPPLMATNTLFIIFINCITQKFSATVRLKQQRAVF